MGRETKAKRKSPNDVTRGSIFTKEDIERIKSNAYRDIGKGVKDKRRSKLPPVKEVQTPSQIKDLLKAQRGSSSTSTSERTIPVITKPTAAYGLSISMAERY